MNWHTRPGPGAYTFRLKENADSSKLRNYRTMLALAALLAAAIVALALCLEVRRNRLKLITKILPKL